MAYTGTYQKNSISLIGFYLSIKKFKSGFMNFSKSSIKFSSLENKKSQDD